MKHTQTNTLHMSTRNECHLPALFLPLSQQEDTDMKKRQFDVSLPKFIQKQIDKKREKQERMRPYENTFEAFDRIDRSIRDHFSKGPWQMVNDAFDEGKKDERYAKFYHKYETEMDIDLFMQMCNIPYALYENSPEFFRYMTLQTQRRILDLRSVGKDDLFWGMGDHVLPRRVFRYSMPEEHVARLQLDKDSDGWKENMQAYGDRLKTNPGGGEAGAPFWLYVTREGLNEAGKRKYIVRGFGGATRAYGLKYDPNEERPHRRFTKVKVVIFLDQKDERYDEQEAYNLFDEREAAYNIQKDALSPDYWDLHEDEYIIQYLNQKNQVLEAIHTGEHGMLGIWAARVDQISKLTNPKLMGVWTNQADIPVNGMATRQKFLNMDLEHYFFRD